MGCLTLDLLPQPRHRGGVCDEESGLDEPALAALPMKPATVQEAVHEREEGRKRQRNDDEAPGHVELEPPG